MQMFRASYSTLSQWAQGNLDQALNMYFKRADYETPAMRLGRELHTKFEKEVKANNCMPVVFGAKQLRDPKVEIFARKQLAPWLELRGKLDLMDGDVGYDWKTGATASTSYGNSYQHKVYQILYPHLRRFEYHAFNPYVDADRAVTVSIVHLNRRTMYDGMEWVIAQASDMKSYIEENDLERILAPEGAAA